MFDKEISLNLKRKTMEDLFFIEHDKKLIAQFQALKKMKETKKNLSAVSGIRDDAVLQKLVDLNIHPETVASVALIPLIEVAWADGNIDEKERAAVLKAAAGFGFSRMPPDMSILEEWLEHRPPPRMMTAWAHYVQGLCAELSDGERLSLKDEIISHTRAIAKASGGFLGLTSPISNEEANILDELEAAFC